MQRVFNPRNEVYVVSVSWDYSGAPPVQYPAYTANPAELMSRLKEGEKREFIGAGLPLFPARRVVGGLSTRVMLWECDQDIRRFGTSMAHVSQAIQSSELTQVLSALAGSNPTTAVISTVAQAALALTRVIGDLLKTNSDDFVDYFEGFYPASDSWNAAVEPVRGPCSAIELTKFS